MAPGYLLITFFEGEDKMDESKARRGYIDRSRYKCLCLETTNSITISEIEYLILDKRKVVLESSFGVTCVLILDLKRASQG